MAARHRVSVRLTDAEHVALVAVARRAGLDTADLLRLSALGYARAGGDDLRGCIRLKPRSEGFRLPQPGRTGDTTASESVPLKGRRPVET